MSAQLQILDKHGDTIVGLAAFGHESGDLVDGVNHGGVVATTEETSDCRIRQIGKFAEYIHRFLSGHNERPLATLSAKSVNSKAQQASYFGEELLIGAVFGSRAWKKVLEETFGLGNRHVNPIET